VATHSLTVRSDGRVDSSASKLHPAHLCDAWNPDQQIKSLAKQVVLSEKPTTRQLALISFVESVCWRFSANL